MNVFQKRLQEALSLRNMKQVDLVEKTKFSKSKISQYVNGVYQPKPDALFAIAKALNVSEGWLMGEDVPIERSERIQPTLTDEEYALLTQFREMPKLEQTMAKDYFKYLLKRIYGEL